MQIIFMNINEVDGKIENICLLLLLFIIPKGTKFASVHVTL